MELIKKKKGRVGKREGGGAEKQVRRKEKEARAKWILGLK